MEKNQEKNFLFGSFDRCHIKKSTAIGDAPAISPFGDTRFDNVAIRTQVMTAPRESSATFT